MGQQGKLYPPAPEKLSAIKLAPGDKKVATSTLEQPEIYYLTDLEARSPTVFLDHGPFEDSREELFPASS